MRAATLALILIVTASVMPASAQDDPPVVTLPPDWATRFASLVLVIPATLALLGEINDRACAAAGEEFQMADEDVGPGGHWFCPVFPGLPRREDGTDG